jgi:hypothetical protein
MQHGVEKQANVDTAKKQWSIPVFEIISKEVVQGGTNPGAESVNATQHS